MASHFGENGGGKDVFLTQVLYLVTHERDKWGDDEAETVTGKSGHLKSDRLAASCWHQCQGVDVRIDASDDVFLQRSKGVIAPVLL